MIFEKLFVIVENVIIKIVFLTIKVDFFNMIFDDDRF